MNGPEQLCTWYLRLNGYLTITNFHEHDRHRTIGEIDVIGVRFPHSRELDFEDDIAYLQIMPGKIDVVLAEAEKGDINEQNNPWKLRTKGALEYAIRRIGIVSPEEFEKACTSLYEARQFTRDGLSLHAVCCGRSVDNNLEKQGITSLEWTRILAFIQNRFQNNAKLKAQHEQWDWFGQYLWEQLAESSSRNEAAFFSGWERSIREHNL